MSREFAVFLLGDALFAVDVTHVREVLRAAALAPAPGRDCVEGVLNLRGDVVAVVDVRAALGLPEQSLSAADYLIVLEANGRIGIVRSNCEVRLETVADEAVQPAGTVSSVVANSVRLEHEVASVLGVGELLELIST